MACATWLRRDFLIRHGRTPDEPPCNHDPCDCPETRTDIHTLPAVDADIHAIEARRLGESEEL